MLDYVLLRLRGKIVGTAKYFTAGTSIPGEPARKLHGQSFKKYARNGEDLVVVYNVQIFSEYIHVPYPYQYGGAEAPPVWLGDLNVTGKHFKAFIAWDNKQILPHSSGVDLGDSPRNVSQESFPFANEPPGLEQSHRSKRLRWHQSVVDVRNNNPTPRLSTQHEHSEDVIDNAQNIKRTLVSRAGTNEESVPALRRSFSRFKRPSSEGVPVSNEFSSVVGSSTHEVPRGDLDIGTLQTNESPEADDEQSDGHVATGGARGHVEATSRTQDDRSVDIRCHKRVGTAQQVRYGRNADSSVSGESDGTESGCEEECDETGYDEDDELMSDTSVEEKNCRQILPLPRKRRYVYHTRKRCIPEGPRDLRKRRKALSQRVDNPFLKSGLHCCKALKCFENIDQVFAFKTYKEVMCMNREDFKAFLISIYQPEERCFRMEGKKVCARYLQKGFGFSNDLQSSVKNTPYARAGPTAEALPRDVRRVSKKDYIINFLRNYAGECGDMMPHAWFTNLPDVARKEVYDKFMEDFRKACANELPPTISYFYSVWKEYCREIRTRRNHGFSKCEVCIFLKAEAAENKKHKSIVRRATEALREHLDMVKEERLFYHNRCERATRYPNKYMSLVVDGADQKSFGIPHFCEQSKSDKGHKLKIKCVGVLEHRSSNRLWLFPMTEEFLTGANHVLEVVHRTITARKIEAGKLPGVLYVQVDNCTRENKNRYFLSFFEMLISLGVFLEVEISFLPVGHTHVDVDQAFSAVGKILKRRDATTMYELIEILGQCYKGEANAFRLDRVANYSGLCEESGCLVSSRVLRGFTDYRFFRFTRGTGNMEDGERFRTQCHVKFQCRDEWQPLSLGPIKGFLKTIPDLRSTPHTETFPPDDVTEVNQCLTSLHSRNRKLAARVVPQLEKLRDGIFTKRSDPFHWDLDQCFELNGDFVSSETDDSQSSADEADGQDANETEYEPESFIAVKPEGEATNRFWIAMILKVVDRSSSNRPRWLQVLWYSQKGESGDEFSARYVPSKVYNPRLKKLVPYEDQVDVCAILLKFPSLNVQGYLRANTRTALRQVLGLN